MSPRPVRKEPANAVVGLILGILWGGGIGLGLCIWVLPVTLWFPGDTMIAGAIVCGVLGYFKGDDFFRWMRDHWIH